MLRFWPCLSAVTTFVGPFKFLSIELKKETVTNRPKTQTKAPDIRLYKMPAFWNVKKKKKPSSVFINSKLLGKENSHVTSLPKCSQELDLGQAKARSQEQVLVSPVGGKDPSNCHQRLPPSIHIHSDSDMWASHAVCLQLCQAPVPYTLYCRDWDCSTAR